MTGWNRCHEDIAMHFLAFVRVFGLLQGRKKLYFEILKKTFFVFLNVTYVTSFSVQAC